MTSYFDEELWYGSSAASEAEAEQKAAKSIAAKVGRIIGAKPFPVAAQRLSELTRDPNCPMQAVVDVLESDPALSARLLRLVNSAGYSLRTACTSVAHAAALVGVRKLNQVASTAAILDLYETGTEVAATTLEHAAIVGALCRYLAAHLGLPQEEMFTCGFLHDIGKLMLLESEGQAYADMLRAAADEPDTVYAHERMLLGYDHALLGGHVLAAWHIPAPVPKVVAWHHHVARAYEDSILVARMVSVVRLADAMSVALFRQFPEFEVERLSRTEAASYLDISEPQIAAMWDEMFLLAERARLAFRGESPAQAEPEAEPANDVEHDAVPVQSQRGEESPQTPHKEPRFFPCVACGVPSYANVCRACHGYMCPTHQDPDEEWCKLCAQEYAALEIKFPPWIYGVVGSAIGAMLVGTLVGAAGAVTGSSLKVLVAPGLLSMLGAVCIAAWQRFFRRMWFMRTCPDRQSMLPSQALREDEDDLELPVVSKRWIQPLSLDARGPIIRELWQDSVFHDEDEHDAPRSQRGRSQRPSLVPSAAGERSVNGQRPVDAQRASQGERHVSLRPSLRAADSTGAARSLRPGPTSLDAAAGGLLPSLLPIDPVIINVSSSHKPAALEAETTTKARRNSKKPSAGARKSKRAPSTAAASNTENDAAPPSMSSARPSKGRRSAKASTKIKAQAESPAETQRSSSKRAPAKATQSISPTSSPARSSFRPGAPLPSLDTAFGDDPPLFATSSAPRLGTAGGVATTLPAPAAPSSHARRSRAKPRSNQPQMVVHPAAEAEVDPEVNAEVNEPSNETPRRRRNAARA